MTFFHVFCQKKGCCKALDYLSEYPETGANISEEKGGRFYGYTYLWTMSERKCNQKENVICSKYSVWFVGGQRQEVFDGKNDSGW